ncbi:aspartate--tRNA(Asn) ligase [Candidatus Curtissbacteria bacterium]|nr:aspartate--tRNA(Asn) ligase [Candidatus Curtissbacteria bacterium]
MKRTLAIDCVSLVDKEVTVMAWVDTKRDHGKITFIDVHDRTGLIQVVGVGDDFRNLHPQDVVAITGIIQKRPESMVNKKIETGGIELKGSKVEILTKAHELPFDMGTESLNLELPTLLDFRSLTLRHPQVKAIFKVQAAVVEGFRKAATDLGCIEIFVPTTAASSTEGGAEVFKIDYYGHKAFLTQSPQLYKQMLVPVFERVFTISHAYRAEPSVTTRHLSESTQLDCEFGFVDFNELLDLVETVAVEMLKYAEEKCQAIFKEFSLEKIAFGKIPRLTLREAQEIIFKEFKRDSRKEKDLAPQDEVDICKWAKEKHDSDFVTITHFPTKAKPFYTKPDPEDEEYSLSYDLLFRGVEVLSGSQRINDYDQLIESIKSRGMDPKSFELYLQAFKFGMPPEGGLSFGLERLTMHILNLRNVREASLFPRDMERVDVRLSTIKDQK